MVWAGTATRWAREAATLIFLVAPPAFSQTAGAAGFSPETSGVAIGRTSGSPTSPYATHRAGINPVTGLTSVSPVDFQPLTLHERWDLYLKYSFWSEGAYFGPMATALIVDQASDSPRQWGEGFAGYGRRGASRVATGNVVGNSIQHPLAGLLKEDVRYIESGQQGLGRRTWHAFVYTFVTFNSQGHPTPNIAFLTANYASTAISTRWLPGRRNVLSYTLSNGTEALELGVAFNVVQEFWPEISHKLFRRR